MVFFFFFCVCVCVMDYCSAIKKNEIMPFAATLMDLQIIRLSELSHTKINIVTSHVESRKIDSNELICKTDIENKLTVTKEEGERINKEFWISRYT